MKILTFLLLLVTLLCGQAIQLHQSGSTTIIPLSDLDSITYDLNYTEPPTKPVWAVDASTKHNWVPGANVLKDTIDGYDLHGIFQTKSSRYGLSAVFNGNQSVTSATTETVLGSGWHFTLEVHASVSSTSTQTLFSYGDTDTEGLSLSVNSDGKYQVLITGSGPVKDTLVSPGMITLNQDTYVAFSYDVLDQTAKLYVSGVQVSSKILNGLYLTGRRHTTIGEFQGTLHGARTSSVARTALDIQTINSNL